MLKEGDKAPVFKVLTDTGEEFDLAQHQKERIVLYFYPRADTPGCTTEACEFRDSFASLRAEGAEVWGISPDGTASHGKFRAKFDLPFTLLADEGASVAAAYGAWVEKNRAGRTYMGVQRSTFLVGPDGTIARAWHSVTPAGHAAEVRETLIAAKRTGA